MVYNRKKYYKKYGKKYRLEHKEEIKERMKKWRENHKEEIKEYRVKNKEKYRIQKKEYRKTSEKYKTYHKKNNNKRVRGYDFIRTWLNLLDEPTVEHHIDNDRVVAVPKDLHESFMCGSNKYLHRVLVGQIVKQIYGGPENRILKA